jgi:hypothetical protein
MPLEEVVRDVRQILPGDAQEVRVVEIAGGEHHGGGAVGLPVVRAPDLDREAAVGLAADVGHVLARADVEPVVLGHAPIVDEPIPARRLLVARDERDAADLDPLRRREERHAERIALDRADDRSPVQQHAGHVGLLRGDARRQTARAGADDQEVGGLGHTSMIWSRRVPTLT